MFDLKPFGDPLQGQFVRPDEKSPDRLKQNLFVFKLQYSYILTACGIVCTLSDFLVFCMMCIVACMAYYAYNNREKLKSVDNRLKFGLPAVLGLCILSFTKTLPLLLMGTGLGSIVCIGHACCFEKTEDFI